MLTTITLKPDDFLNVVIGAHTISIEHITDADNGHAIQLRGVHCNLEGEMPGLYYPTPLGTVGQPAS